MLSEIFISAPAFPQFPCCWFGKKKPNPPHGLGPFFLGGEYYATLDSRTMIMKIPPIQKGASHWIRKLWMDVFFFPGGRKEEQMMRTPPKCFFPLSWGVLVGREQIPIVFFPSKWSCQVFFFSAFYQRGNFFISPKNTHFCPNLQVHVQHDGQFNLQWVDSFLWCVGG